MSVDCPKAQSPEPRAQSPEVDSDRAGQPCLLPIPTLGCWKHIYALVLREQAEAREEVSSSLAGSCPLPGSAAQMRQLCRWEEQHPGVLRAWPEIQMFGVHSPQTWVIESDTFFNRV